MEDCKYKLSIIIPMYNAEKYIADCLDSILNSDLPKDSYEVIIVNDGSDDKGPIIANEYVRKYENFVYLTQENQGQSVARNYGLNVAQGKYVWFVDSDDKVETTLKLFLDKLEEYELDSLVTAMHVTDEEGINVVENGLYSIPYNTVIPGRNLFFSNVPIGSVCANFLKRKLLIDHQLYFLPNIAQQDVELSNRLFSYAKRIMFVKEPSYVYIKHPESTSMSNDVKKKEKYVLNTIDVILSLQNLAQEIDKTDRLLACVIREKSYSTLLGLLITLFRHKCEWRKNGINNAVILELKEKGLYPIKYSFSSWKKNIIKTIINFEYLYLKFCME